MSELKVEYNVAMLGPIAEEYWKSGCGKLIDLSKFTVKSHPVFTADGKFEKMVVTATPLEDGLCTSTSTKAVA